MPQSSPRSSDAREEIDFEVLKRLIDFVLANGVVGLIPGGTTGEVYALSDAERLELFRFVKDYAGGRMDVDRGRERRGHARRRAVRRGCRGSGLRRADGGRAAYSRPSQRELLAHFKDVATATALPIVLYNFPWRAGSEIGYHILDGLAGQANVIGIKEASSDLSRLIAMRLRYGDRFQISCGSDDQALDYFVWGSTSWIGGGASCAPRQHVAVLEAALAGDFATARARMEKTPAPAPADGGRATTPRRSKPAASSRASRSARRDGRCCPSPRRTWPRLPGFSLQGGPLNEEERGGRSEESYPPPSSPPSPLHNDAIHPLPRLPTPPGANDVPDRGVAVWTWAAARSPSN